MKETELAKPVVQWLTDQHWDVYQEVQFNYGGGIADILAVKNNIMWIIETKTSMTFTVLEQASKWLSHYRSIAIPSAKRDTGRKFSYLLADKVNVGIIEVNTRTFNGSYLVTEIEPAKLMREHNEYCRKFMFPKLREEHKTFAEAGNNHGNRYTPYQGTINQVRNYIQKNPGCTIKEIFDELGRCHYSNTQSAKGSVLSALQTFESSWCETVRDEKQFRFYIKDKSNGWV